MYTFGILRSILQDSLKIHQYLYPVIKKVFSYWDTARLILVDMRLPLLSFECVCLLELNFISGNKHCQLFFLEVTGLLYSFSSQHLALLSVNNYSASVHCFFFFRGNKMTFKNKNSVNSPFLAYLHHAPFPIVILPLTVFCVCYILTKGH